MWTWRRSAKKLSTLWMYDMVCQKKTRKDCITTVRIKWLTDDVTGAVELRNRWTGASCARSNYRAAKQAGFSSHTTRSSRINPTIISDFWTLKKMTPLRNVGNCLPVGNPRSLWPFGAGIIFFLISAHPVYKMWTIQEPKKLALWNKLHFEEEKTESIEHV